MRRMYGDESYINILRAEFEKNDIELKYDEYNHHFADDLRQFQYDDDYELIDDDQSKLNADESRGFISRSFNDPIAKRLNKFPKLSEYTRPHFRPTEQTTSSTVSSTKIPSSILSSTSSTSATTFDTHTSFSTTPVSNTTVMSMEEKQEEETKTPPLVTLISPKFSNTTVEIADVAVNNTTTTALPSITVAQMVREQNFSINEIPGQNDRIDEDLEELVEVVAHSKETTVREDTTLESAGTTTMTTATSFVVSMESLVERDEEAEVLGAATKTTVHEEIIAAASHEQQQFRPRPEYRPPSVAESSASVSGQLYQDVAAKDHHEQPVLKLRGVNACPVKEEVVAPFWANNTRGEVLALLNLYPFEQYVHWEKCT
ncbi:hypothetical protein RF55_7784 [Lasius niger]|uniref:Uncharacterized protein n=1 Tax=Lasius niger TaxID=67767 RepID=A0A0J7NIC6_LASNI|nr:hypothetical protein RF55_7784 [Lasius niger]